MGGTVRYPKNDSRRGETRSFAEKLVAARPSTWIWSVPACPGMNRTCPGVDRRAGDLAPGTEQICQFLLGEIAYIGRNHHWVPSPGVATAPESRPIR